MKNFYKQLDNIGLTTLSQFTGVNAEEEPHSAFLHMLCNSKLLDKEQVMTLTGLSPLQYELVFQEQPKQGNRELVIAQDSIKAIFYTLQMENILPHQERTCRLILRTMLDYDFARLPENVDYYRETPLKENGHLEFIFRNETREVFAQELNEALVEIWAFVKAGELLAQELLS